uniref:NIN-like protein n=1 Tax=Tanacetum cinerariifolium TaxID=118510 RepID=A0A6L2KZF0_TANCI|nr:NIN-like protein [Tanacetum cinerariifolium]
MGLCSHLQSLNSSDEGKTPGFRSVSGMDVVGINELTALKQMTFREQHVIVQFWSPAQVVGKHQVLTTMDQPFGLGEIKEQLTSYRKESQHNLYVVDDDHEEEELGPPARVFRRRLPEWTPDVANYLPRQFPQKESVIRHNLHGYLALPVIDLFTGSCVGVLEILTSSKYISYAYEIQQVQSALKVYSLLLWIIS